MARTVMEQVAQAVADNLPTHLGDNLTASSIQAKADTVELTINGMAFRLVVVPV